MTQQIELFDLLKKRLWRQPIRLIELFGGIGSQHKALTRLGVPISEHYLVEIDAIDQSIANNWKGIFPLGKQVKKDDKVTYSWQAELKAEQEAHDAKQYQPKRSAKEIKEGFGKL